LALNHTSSNGSSAEEKQLPQSAFCARPHSKPRPSMEAAIEAFNELDRVKGRPVLFDHSLLMLCKMQ